MNKMLLFIGLLLASMVANAGIISTSEFRFFTKCPDYTSSDDCIEDPPFSPVGILTLRIDTSVVDSDPFDGNAFFANALLSATFYDALDDKFYSTIGVSDLRTDGLDAASSALEIADPDNDIIEYYQASIFPDFTLFDSDGASIHIAGGQLIFYDTPSLGLSLIDFNVVRQLGMDGDSSIRVNGTAFIGNDGEVLSVISVPEPAGIALAMFSLALVGFRRRLI